MKKRIALLLSLVMLALMLTSCVRMEMDFTIKKNGKVDASILYAVDTSMGSMSDLDDAGLTAPEDLEDMREEGWDVQPYSDGTYQGYRMTRKNVEMKDALDSTAMGETDIAFTKKGSTYILDIPLFDSDTDSESMEALSMLKMVGGSFKLRLTLPNKPVSHNATNVSEDGKTLEWDLLSMTPGQTVHVEFKMGGGFLKYVAIMTVILLVVVAALFLLSKKKQPATTPVVVAPEQPVAPTTVTPEPVAQEPATQEMPTQEAPTQEVPAQETPTSEQHNETV